MDKLQKKYGCSKFAFFSIEFNFFSSSWRFRLIMERRTEEPRHAREVVIFGFPHGTTEEVIKEFLNTTMKAFGGQEDKDVVRQVRLSKTHCTVEFYKILWASAIFGLDRVPKLKYYLSIERPFYYKPLDSRLKRSRKIDYTLEDDSMNGPDMKVKKVLRNSTEFSNAVCLLKLVPEEDFKAGRYHKISLSLTTIVEQYGVVDKLSIATDGINRGNVYIKFRNIENAKEAINDLQGKTYNSILIIPQPITFETLNKGI